MLVDNEVLLMLCDKDASKFGTDFLRTHHNLHESNLFSDEPLCELIDGYPRHQLQAFTMGSDPTAIHELEPVDTSGANGKDILKAVANHRLWFKLQRIDRASPYSQMISSFYRELGDLTGKRFLVYNAVLILSSRGSQVYFHFDAKPNFLVNLRGVKRFWLYPALRFDIINMPLHEDVFANAQDEEVPYHHDFDRLGTQYVLRPGDMLSWPQNSPHRVEVEEGISVSISSFYETNESVRRTNIFLANRMLRKKFRMKRLSVNEQGIAASAKTAFFRICRRMNLVEQYARRPYRARLRIDGRSRDGVTEIQGDPVLTEFAQGSSAR